MWRRDPLIGLVGCSVVRQSGSFPGNHTEVFPSDDALAGAHRLALEHGIFDRPLGVAGIWGAIIRRWLDDLLPPDAVQLCSGRVRLVVTEVPVRCCPMRRRPTSRLFAAAVVLVWALGRGRLQATPYCMPPLSLTARNLNHAQVPSFRQVYLDEFQSRDDLLDAALASSHIPFLMDWQPTARAAGKRFIGGSQTLFPANIQDSSSREAGATSAGSPPA